MRLVELVWCVLLLSTVISVSAETIQTIESDSVFPTIVKPSVKESMAWREDSVHRKNPVLPGAASMIVPGAGQCITGHYVKAVFFIALESIFTGQALYWRSNSAVIERNANNTFNANMKSWKAMDTATRSRSDSISFCEDLNLNRHGAMDMRFDSYNFTVWAVGAYIYNVLDAVNSSDYFRNSDPKKPGTAALLAAVPGLGLGQLYNGSISKAGMVMMGQFSLGMMAYNSQRLMTDADNNYGRLTSSQTDSLTRAVGVGYWGNGAARSIGHLQTEICISGTGFFSIFIPYLMRRWMPISTIIPER